MTARNGSDESLLEDIARLARSDQNCDESHARDIAKLIAEINNLAQHRFSLKKQLQEASGGAAEDDEVEKTEEALLQRGVIAGLLTRVCEPARQQILQDASFVNTFLDRRAKAYVLAVDIRRSTDLMLKASDPDAFALFITRLALELRGAVMEHFGIFDRFTGDGIIGYFPEFYAGPDAGIHCLLAAAECHVRFNAHYGANRQLFTTVLKDVGLGIGIDYGEISMRRIGSDLIVVGKPVVYACRFSSAPPGRTLLNQAAYQSISDSRADQVLFAETELKLKHEGMCIAYEPGPLDLTMPPTRPQWAQDV